MNRVYGQNPPLKSEVVFPPRHQEAQRWPRSAVAPRSTSPDAQNALNPEQLAQGLDDDGEISTGAIIGGVAGGIIGGLVGGFGGALLGAGLGAGIGALAGAGKGAGAPKTVTINITVLSGASDNSARDLSASNAIFNRAGCGLRVAAGTIQSLDATQTNSVLGSDGLLEEPSGPTVSSEEQTLLGFNRTQGRLTAYYVPGFNPSKRGTSLQTPRHGVADSLIMGGSAGQDTFTHELGHILMRDPSHSSDPDNLMADGGIRNIGTDNLTTAQCSSLLTATSYPQ